MYAKNQLCRCPTYCTKRDVLIRSLRRRPYRMKPTAVGFISLNTVIGTGCRVQVFSLILDSSVGLSAGIQSAGDLVSETLMGSNPAFSRGRQLLSIRISIACARASKLTTTNMYDHWGEPHDGCSCNHRQHGRGRR